MKSTQTTLRRSKTATFAFGLALVGMLVGCASASARRPATGDEDATARPADARDGSALHPLSEEISRVFEQSGEAGAAIVLDAETGGLLASVEFFDDAMHDAGHRRAFAPASSVKPLLVMAALDAGVIEPGHETSCAGNLDVDGQTLTCYATHGRLDIAHGLATSCNVFAYDVAQRLGLERIEAAFTAYGFGGPTGVFEDEASGTILGSGADLPEGRGVSAALVGTGHGPLRVTAIQLGRAYLQLLARDPSPGRNAVFAGLRAAVEDEVGTARAARVEGVAVGAKTGTAHHVDAEGQEIEGRYDTWFVAVAPLDEPEIVLVVQTLDTQPAPDSAAVVGGAILRSWWDRRLRPTAPVRR